ncbi:DMT family transporter [Sphaerisporangium sp. TRM90804]|uniref:DMT family transporter n=1 Tax=Sphaerisporangium sp. TRM90804 TaxID=3031113 RepID=UPI0024483491|nr:DMT family transporter [Sphaerisporangium sp. TRM90804]MDH2427447.1 DMT family transporter [Sphaerisporangium sp. TRM90804]
MWVGVSIALVGALGYAAGAALQQYEAVRAGASLKLVRRPRWVVGGIIGLLGAGMHAVALALAPLVLVQPVSVATLVFAVPLAAALHGRRPSKEEILGSVAVAAGLLGLMLLIPHSDVRPVMSTPEALGFLACVALVAGVCELAARRASGSGKALLLSVGAGAVTASVSTLVRVVGGGLDGDLSRLLHWFTVAIPILLVCAIILLQRSYAIGHFGIAYAGVQVVDPITSVLAGTILLGEPVPSGVGNVIPALAAAAVLIAGTITLSRLTPDTTHAVTTPHPEIPVPIPAQPIAGTIPAQPSSDEQLSPSRR